METYDNTTIRAGTPMYLLSRRIKSMGIKMVLSGEGADESFGGYLYFHKAPNPAAFQKETVNKVKELHKFDCLRANKAMMAWGVEARVPFLDREFLDWVMEINPLDKMCGFRGGSQGSSQEGGTQADKTGASEAKEEKRGDGLKNPQGLAPRRRHAQTKFRVR